MPRIKLSEPIFNEDITGQVRDALACKEVGYQGAYIESFRRELQEYLSFSNVGLYSSGTASIHLALKLADVQTGDEVLCQSLTFSASANPIKYLNANPVFIGSEKETWNMCPKFLEEALEDRKKKGKRVKAIIPVHVFGMPANMNDLIPIAQHYGVPIIEDAAEALGASVGGQYCGTIGEYGIFSFNANKIITAGGGGALLAKDNEKIKEANFFALQAKDSAPHYEHSQLGYNYAFSNLNAILGCSQMEQLEGKINKRRAIFDWYYSFLSDHEIGFQMGTGNMRSSRWLTAVMLPHEEQAVGLRHFLEERNIESRPVWKPMHLQPFYSSYPYFGDRTEEGFFKRGLCLPSGNGLTLEDVSLVSSYILEFQQRTYNVSTSI
ncbi:DegT/DnrJ/EryC1/StrS family aminotransferase [Echinicola rosea]|uniref:Pyridoxal phosphate-dependent aminotransferase n=1 Tax=Echinicola rosea TaxID=1807691 RepID=A0ABQ1V6K3_9BACT|nr:DegT/DnrJ/EryC1/StrS family aminotransferase [Echinicola rosea]GGF41345.1 pyridoxal phosphate-dependent aminotransferase [Echinicola rosea]